MNFLTRVDVADCDGKSEEMPFSLACLPLAAVSLTNESSFEGVDSRCGRIARRHLLVSFLLT